MVVLPKWARISVIVLLVLLSIQSVFGDLFMIKLILSNFSRGVGALILIFGSSIFITLTVTPIYMMYWAYAGGITFASGATTKLKALLGFLCWCVGGILLSQGFNGVVGFIVGYLLYK